MAVPRAVVTGAIAAGNSLQMRYQPNLRQSPPRTRRRRNHRFLESLSREPRTLTHINPPRSDPKSPFNVINDYARDHRRVAVAVAERVYDWWCAQSARWNGAEYKKDGQRKDAEGLMNSGTATAHGAGRSSRLSPPQRFTTTTPT
jgi:hypothetical protein